MSARIAVAASCVLLFGNVVYGGNNSDSAPERFRVRFETTAGSFAIDVVRKWAPVGADHFYRLVQEKYYDECRFFRVVPGFVVQFGMNGDPDVLKKWRKTPLQDEPVVASNMTGFVTFAKGGPDSRTTQLFINLADNQRLDALGFPPIGQVVEGMDVVRKINSEYREQPRQDRIAAAGNAYLKARFPRLDFIRKATIVPAEDKPAE